MMEPSERSTSPHSRLRSGAAEVTLFILFLAVSVVLTSAYARRNIGHFTPAAELRNA